MTDRPRLGEVLILAVCGFIGSAMGQWLAELTIGVPHNAWWTDGPEGVFWGMIIGPLLWRWLPSDRIRERES